MKHTFPEYWLLCSDGPITSRDQLSIMTIDPIFRYHLNVLHLSGQTRRTFVYSLVWVSLQWRRGGGLFSYLQSATRGRSRHFAKECSLSTLETQPWTHHCYVHACCQQFFHILSNLSKFSTFWTKIFSQTMKKKVQVWPRDLSTCHFWHPTHVKGL